jgi:hypothetical protein
VSFNPLVTDLDQYNDNQLENRIIDLQRKYFLTHNPQVKEQIVNILDIYRIELRTRQAVAAQKQREQNGDSGLDDLIKVS